MEPTLRPPSMQSDDNFPSYGYFLVLAILLGILCAIPFHSSLKKWFREKFGKWFSRISSCLRTCVCGSEENERDDDDQEQIELNDLVNELDFPPQQNRDNLRPHRDPRLPELPIRMRELQNNPIDRQLQNDLINRELQNNRINRELQNNLINLHPDEDIGEEHRVNGPPEILVEMRNLGNNLYNRPNGDVLRYQEHSL